VTLLQIETTVSAYLGPGRVSGNKQSECGDALLEVLSGDLRSAAPCGPPVLPLAWTNSFIDGLVDGILRRLMSGRTLPCAVRKLAEDFVPN
jgi:hypothetical protein